MLGHILVVDDDDRIRFLIAKFLKEHNYIVSTANDIKSCEEQLKEFIFDLIILDTIMPGESGIEFLKRKNGHFKTPIIMLTALGDVDDRINGLESGADDYLAKPFEPKELLLRIQKILKRNDASKLHKQCVFGEYRFDIQSSNLKKNDEYIHLTTNESKILQILAQKPGEIISRDEILNCFLGVNIRTIDVIVARLRAKIEGTAKAPEYLQTIRNQGYVLWGKLEEV